MSNEQLKHKTYLAVGYDDRAQAQEEIGRLNNGVAAISFDGEQGLWYAKAGTEKRRVEPWLPDPNMMKQHSDKDPLLEFNNVLETAGFLLKEPPLMDGQIHRVATQDDKRGQKSGVYAVFNDGHPVGWYQDHRNHSEPQKWHASFEQADPTARLHQKAHMANIRYQREQSLNQKQQHHAKRCAQLYRQLPMAYSGQGYSSRKGVQAYPGVCQDKKGRLVIPLYDTEQNTHSLHRISPNGFKCLKKGAQKSGHFFVVGDRPLNANEPILYAEGYSTAASIAEATGRSVVMTVDAGNMPKVAEKISAKYPNAKHLFLADNDHKNQINKGIQKARESANLVGGHWLTPKFSTEQIQHGLTDFNDLHMSNSVFRVKKQIEGYIERCWPELKYQKPERLQPALNSIMPVSPTLKTIATQPQKTAFERVKAPETELETKPDNPTQPTKPNKEQPEQEASKMPMPKHLYMRYTSANGKSYFPNRNSAALAFIDKGNKLQTRLEHSKIIMDLLAIAEHRGWQQIKLKGSQNFKREAWLQAKIKGMEVTGYKPQPLDYQRLAQQGIKVDKQSQQTKAIKTQTQSTTSPPMQQATIQAKPQSALERFKERFTPQNSITKSRFAPNKETHYEHQLEH
ncbi:LPD7 domain-containing protein [Parashewanella tropica]|uniref:LPD7 domain-containing protein n=1 Tax=Parashewanella tropica TaxID=2547970 RepID=UPI001059D446|nr:LPD7 domain-containing protein [Parashewanella tropica]